MITKEIIHVGMGRTGEACVRNFMCNKLGNRLKFLETTAHLPLEDSRKISPTAPSFTFVRNPFDWYIATYIRDLEVHRWRGGFREWINMCTLLPKSNGGSGDGQIGMTKYYEFLTGYKVNYVGRYERMLDDLIYIMGRIIPDIVTEQELRDWFPDYMTWSYGCNFQEGTEQWLREELYAPPIIEWIYQTDRYFFDRFGYNYEEKYYFPGNVPGPSSHPALIIEQEKEFLPYKWVDWTGRNVVECSLEIQTVDANVVEPQSQLGNE